MDTKNTTQSNDLDTLADDARALIAATADVAGEKVVQARRRLATALESGKQIYGKVREKAIEHAAATDRTVRENPYQAIGIAVGVGVVIGCFVGSRWCRRDR